MKTLFFVCQPGKPENGCQQNAASKIDTLQCFMPTWKFPKNSKSPCFSPNLLKTELFLCNNCIARTFFLDIKQNKNCDIYSILWKCQQERYPSRIDISPNKSLGTPALFITRLAFCGTRGSIQTLLTFNGNKTGSIY